VDDLPAAIRQASPLSAAPTRRSALTDPSDVGPVAGIGPLSSALASGRLQSLAHQVAELQADNDRLRGDNARLCAAAERLRAVMRQTGGDIARCASDLLAGTGD
jgi:hypothetical protein